MAPINNIKKVRRPRKNKSKDYVDNDLLYAAVCEYKTKCKECEAAGKPLPNMPNYIGVAAMKISENFANNYSYRGFIYKDEMIQDGILFCIKAVSSFNVEKYNNVFTYFTQAVQFGFWQKIESEKKQLYTKYKLIDRASIYSEMYDGDSNDASGADMPFSEGSVSSMQDFIKTYEEKLRDKKERELEKKLQKLDENSSKDADPVGDKMIGPLLCPILNEDTEEE